MVRPPRPAPVGQCGPLTLEQRVEELVNQFKGKAAENQEKAGRGQSEASYHYGLAAAFDIVATMLREALAEGREGEE